MAFSHTFKSLNAKLFMFLYFNSFRCKLPTLSPLKAPPHSYYSTNSSPIKIIPPGILPTIPPFSFQLSAFSFQLLCFQLSTFSSLSPQLTPSPYLPPPLHPNTDQPP